MPSSSCHHHHAIVIMPSSSCHHDAIAMLSPCHHHIIIIIMPFTSRHLIHDIYIMPFTSCHIHHAIMMPSSCHHVMPGLSVIRGMAKMVGYRWSGREGTSETMLNTSVQCHFLIDVP
jgi:hypothetical protein